MKGQNCKSVLWRSTWITMTRMTVNFHWQVSPPGATNCFKILHIFPTFRKAGVLKNCNMCLFKIVGTFCQFLLNMGAVGPIVGIWLVWYQMKHTVVLQRGSYGRYLRKSKTKNDQLPAWETEKTAFLQWNICSAALNSIQTVKAAVLRFSSRWCTEFGCELLSWRCCNQIEYYRQKDCRSEAVWGSWKRRLSLTH